MCHNSSFGESPIPLFCPVSGNQIWTIFIQAQLHTMGKILCSGVIYVNEFQMPGWATD